MMHARSLSPLVRPAVLAGTAFLASTAVAAEDARLTLLLDGAVVAEAVADGAAMLDGPVQLSGSASDADWSASWSLLLDADALDGAAIDGEFSFANLSGQVRDVQLLVEVPLCRAIEGPTLVGGSVGMSLSADGDGGMVSVPAGSSGFVAHAGSAEAASVFDAPFFLFASGSGLMSTSGDFGLPSPSLPGPDGADALAAEIDLSVSAGDEVAMDFAYDLAAADAADLGDCSDASGDAPDPDLNGDGFVGVFDLILVIHGWGDCRDACPADLTGDGRVDFMDMVVVLNAWD